MRILNLGTGNKPIVAEEGEEAINHDLRLDPDRPYVTVAWDLNDLPWPWEDNSFDLIAAKAVFEHLRLNLLESVGECWRILRPGGRLFLKLPYWKHENTYLDPTHYWRFSLRTPEIFDPDTEYGHNYDFYMERKWKIVKGPRLNSAKSSFAVTMEVRK